MSREIILEPILCLKSTVAGIHFDPVFKIGAARFRPLLGWEGEGAGTVKLTGG